MNTFWSSLMLVVINYEFLVVNFLQIRPVVEKILPADSNLSVDDFTASRDRLMQIVVHGLLYECCLDFCQSKAISSPVDQLKQSRDSEGTPEKQSPVVRPADVLAGW